MEDQLAQFVGRVMEAPVIMWMCQCFMSRSRSASRSVCTNRSLMRQCLMLRSRSASRNVYTTINQVTKHAKIPQIRHVDTLVDMLLVMQRQAPRIQTVAKTVGVPPVPFTGRIVDVLVIAQIIQVTKLAKIPPVAATGLSDPRCVEDWKSRRRSSSGQWWGCP